MSAHWPPVHPWPRCGASCAHAWAHGAMADSCACFHRHGTSSARGMPHASSSSASARSSDWGRKTFGPHDCGGP
eukprot:10502450-Alexandrium_andersonii.AAC.1